MLNKNYEELFCMSLNLNIERIRVVHKALGSMQDEVVYIGGATVGLYADRMTEEVRPTKDVDIVVEVWAYKDYGKIEETLREQGFENVQEGNVICRYKVNEVIVDIMPTGENVVGFSNRWYGAGFKQAVEYQVDDATTVNIFSAPYFIAAKLEAYKSRGNNDGRLSHDFEDIVYILENRSTIWDEMTNASGDVTLYLKEEFGTLLEHPYFEEWVDSHAGYGSPPATSLIIQNLERFVNQGR